MMTVQRLKTIAILCIPLLLSSCFLDFTGDEAGVNDDESQSAETADPRTDYNSPEQLAKFNTSHIPLPDSIDFYEEIKKADRGGLIHYTALDSLFKAGTDVNEVFYYESSGGASLGFGFSVRGGFRRSRGTGSSRLRETNAITLALKQYVHSVTFETPMTKSGVSTSFDLIHFSLSRGVNPNEEGVQPLFTAVNRLASGYDRKKSRLDDLLELYEFYGFEMKNLDLSACDGEAEVLSLLIDKGGRNYDMNTFDFASSVRPVYEQRDALQEQGVIFDFTQVDGGEFPFDTDTLRLQMFLEMGLSPDHVTPEGKLLRDDFSKFSKEALLKVLDKYLEEHPKG